MSPKEIVEELALEIERLRSDIALMEAGVFRIGRNGVDVTADWMERQRGIADHLETLIAAYRRDNA